MESDQPKKESRLSISRIIKRQKRELERKANSIAAQPSGDSRSPIDDQPWDNSIFPRISEDSVVLNELTILPSNKDSSNIEQHSDSNCSMNEQHSSIDEEEEILPISKDSSSPINEEHSDSISSVFEPHSNSYSSKEEKPFSINNKEGDSSINNGHSDSESSIDDGHSDSESSIDESKVPNAANPFLLKIIAELVAKRLVNFIVDNNEVLGIVSDDA